MLITLKEALHMADKENFAIGAFNSPTLESARAALEAGERMNKPIILQHAEVHFEIMPLEIMGPILVNLAKQATIPVVVHLDHGENLDTIKKSIDIGFSSVMIDASQKPFEENINIVKEIVDYAHSRGVSVEAELGLIGDTGVGGENTGEFKKMEIEDRYTNPDLAKKFVEETNIDALAASFGTAHGIYVTEPQLDFKRLKEIYEATNRPIVMHGGSGLSHWEYKKAINNGVRKINYYSYAAKLAAESVKKFLNENENVLFYDEVTQVARESIRENIKNVIEVFSNK